MGFQLTLPQQAQRSRQQKVQRLHRQIVNVQQMVTIQKIVVPIKRLINLAALALFVTKYKLGNVSKRKTSIVLKMVLFQGNVVVGKNLQVSVVLGLFVVANTAVSLQLKVN